MVWQPSRNLFPSLFMPRIFTGMRVKTRELRRRLSESVEGIVGLSCINATIESTESTRRFPLAATLFTSYNAPAHVASIQRLTTNGQAAENQNRFQGV